MNYWVFISIDNISKIVNLFSHKSVPKLTPLHSPRTQSEGSSFGVFCVLDEGSLPVFFEWTKNGQTIKPGPDVNYKVENSKKLSSLTIDEIMRSDSGNYSCVVRNAIGSDIQSLLLNVKGIYIFRCFFY